MTVKELREKLAEFDDDLIVLLRLHSDWDELTETEIDTAEMINRNGYWSSGGYAGYGKQAKTCVRLGF